MTSIEPRDILDQLTHYTPGKSIQAVRALMGLDEVIKCASNENPFGCPVTSDDLRDAVSDCALYPDVTHSTLVEQLCERHGLSSDQLIFGNGSDECFHFIAQAFVEPGKSVLSSAHTFSVYKHVTTVMGGTYVEAPMTHEYAYDLDAMLGAITPDTRVIYIANPNNPTGHCHDLETLTRFCHAVPDHVIVVIDEAYRDYLPETEEALTLSLLSLKHVIITRTFSKLYGLAGFRIGYAMGHPEVIGLLERVRPPFNINHVALTAASIALTKTEFVTHSRHVNTTLRDQFYTQSSSWPITCLPSWANFVCFFLHHGSADELCEAALKDGLILRSCRSFGLPAAVRLSIGTPDQMKQVYAILSRYFNKEASL